MTAVVRFIHEIAHDDLPPAVADQARRCLLDLLGTAAGGLGTRASAISRDHAEGFFAPGRAASRMLFDGRRVSPPGAALAGAATIDSLDCHDGHRLTKGHAGAAVLPALLAFVDATGRDGRRVVDGGDILAALVMGYEIAIRAGIATHRATDAYPASGSWSAMACAALGARILGLDAAATRHALGIAEYHGPRSPMMRCIDHPAMVKDGTGWGAMAGVSAAYLAAGGFTGAPAATVEGAEAADLWSDLGRRWTITEQYFKPYPVCRWAQPAIEAALALRREHGFSADAVRAVHVITFHEASRLAHPRPQDTDVAQYSLPFPLAAALVRGTVGAEEVIRGLDDPAILRLADVVTMEESADYNARFPDERLARVALELADGRRLESPETPARGDPESPLSDAEIAAKFHGLADATLGISRARAVAAATLGLGTPGGTDADLLLDLVLEGWECTISRRAAG